jgi:methionine synthase I (cobalamin-dependent)/5,10-methylenetetrahydrofolate reductase
MTRDFVEFLRQNIVVCDGAMGTMLYARGIYINQCFEQLNLTRASLVEDIHREYVKAGAEVIETNTFGGNAVRLAAHGLAESVRAINRAGAEVARRAAGEGVFVAGSIGPLGKSVEPIGTIRADEARRCFREQAEALAEGGIDLFILETFLDMQEILHAIAAVRSFSALPIVAQMTIDEDGNTLYGVTPEAIVQILEREDVQVVGLNCSVGPATILEAIERMRRVSAIALSAQPNAGLPRQVEGRLLYLSTPEYMAEYAKRMIQKGARMVGACCGSTPAHIRAIRAAVKALQPSRVYGHIEVSEPREAEGITGVSVCEKSPLAKKIVDGKFVVSVEIDPPRGTDAGKALTAARLLHEQGVDAINIADGPRASARMSPLSLALLFKNEVGIDTILHYCCRDRNILGMQSDLLGAHALGLRNILLITGDPPKLGDYPFATAVFDVDSIGLVRMASRLNRGLDLAGNPIGEPTAFYIGVGANPGAIDLDEEVRRFERKVEGGAEYFLTQPVYDVALLERFLKRVEGCRIPMFVGILPLSSFRNAEFLHNEVPGMQIPEAIRERMRKAESGEKAREEGIAIAQEALREVRAMAQGVYIMPPFGRAESALRVIEILEGF